MGFSKLCAAFMGKTLRDVFGAGFGTDAGGGFTEGGGRRLGGALSPGSLGIGFSRLCAAFMGKTLDEFGGGTSGGSCRLRAARMGKRPDELDAAIGACAGGNGASGANAAEFIPKSGPCFIA